MSETLHPFQQLAQLKEINGSAMRVFLFALPLLERTSFSPLNQEFVGKQLSMAQPAVSKALAKLKEADLLHEGRMDGTNRMYRWNPGNPVVRAFFGGMD